MLTIKSTIGSAENPRENNEQLIKDISQTSLSYMFGIEREEILQAAEAHNIPRQIRIDQGSAIFYKIKDIPPLLRALKSDLASKPHSPKWLENASLEEDEFNLELPDGSSMQYSKS